MQLSTMGTGPCGAVDRVLRICVVGKYPPIQGGISAQCYWMCRWLAERGHQIDVITNADEVEDRYRLRLRGEDLKQDTVRGAIRVWQTEAPTPSYRHVPQTNPVVTKLTSLALEAIEAHGCELVVGFYFEPYAVAAWLAATLSGRRLAIRHAGSDVGRLLNVPQLGRTYAAILRSADMVFARPAARARFLELGVPDARLVADPGSLVAHDCFNSAIQPLDVNADLERIGMRRLDASYPIVGIYGKMGAVKGTFDLLEALIRLKRDGARFTLLAATHGSDEDETRFERTIAAGELNDVVRRLPFLSHQRVASFLRACSVVCLLERGFPIAARAPGTPAEVLACGTPLVISTEIARKQSFAPRIVHGRNALIVRDPRDHDELTMVLGKALADQHALRAMGARGARLLDAPVSAAEQIHRYEELFAAAIDGISLGVDPPLAPCGEGEEAKSWAALQQVNPEIACPEVLDELFFRSFKGEVPEPTSFPALAPNVVVRPFSRSMDDPCDPSPCAYAFQHLPFRDRARIVHLSVGPYLLTKLADGSRSIGEIADVIHSNHDRTLLNVRAAARDLFDEGIITILNGEGEHDSL